MVSSLAINPSIHVTHIRYRRGYRPCRVSFALSLVHSIAVSRVPWTFVEMENVSASPDLHLIELLLLPSTPPRRVSSTLSLSESPAEPLLVSRVWKIRAMKDSPASIYTIYLNQPPLQPSMPPSSTSSVLTFLGAPSRFLFLQFQRRL